MRTKVRKWGNSLALRIPRQCAIESGVGEGTVVDVSARAGRLVVAPVAGPRYTLDELVAGIKRTNVHEETDFGPPVGRELL